MPAVRCESRTPGAIRSVRNISLHGGWHESLDSRLLDEIHDLGGRLDQCIDPFMRESGIDSFEDMLEIRNR